MAVTEPAAGAAHAGLDSIDPRALGTRIQIVGNTGSGKSTLGARLAERLNLPLVELDALNWEPGWHDLSKHAPDELERRIRRATQSDGWIVAGSYSRFTVPLVWPRLHTVLWLDTPLWRVLLRVARRSWQRWRSRELLWGTNRERFWPMLLLWSPDRSLLAFAIRHHRAKRRRMQELMRDPRWAHLRFVRLRSSAEIEALLQRLATSLHT